MSRSTKNRQNRRGAVAIEAAACLPLLLILLLGIWEVGRMIQVQQILVNSAREGARLAAGGYIDSTRVTPTMVQQAARDYLQSAGLPTAAVAGAQIDLVCLASPLWVDPADATPLDRFQVKVKIPAGAAFDSLRWSFVARLTSLTEMEAIVDWVSLNNVEITIDTQLPL